MRRRDLRTQDQSGTPVQGEDERPNRNGWKGYRSRNYVVKGTELPCGSQRETYLLLGLADRCSDQIGIAGLATTAGQSYVAGPRIVDPLGPSNQQE